MKTPKAIVIGSGFGGVGTGMDVGMVVAGSCGSVGGADRAASKDVARGGEGYAGGWVLRARGGSD